MSASRLSPRLAIPIGLVAFTLIVHAGALWNGFTNWDDDLLVTHNALIRRLDAGSVARMFSPKTVYDGDWLPVTILSYAVDHALWGMRPVGFHLTNVLLHALCTVLLYALLARLFGAGAREGEARAAAALAAGLFAIHPVQVESVAWIAERKNVLAMAFFLAAFLAWLRATAAPPRPLAAVAFLVLFALSLLSKSQAVILPPLLLCYEWIERPAFGPKPAPRGLRAALLGMALVLAIGLGLRITQSMGIESLPRKTGTLTGTIATAPVLVLGYLKDLLLPMNRSAILPRRVYATPWRPVPLAAGAIVLAITLGAIARRREHPHFAFFWLWFLGGLALVLNFVPLNALAADRYQYWAAPGLFALAGIGGVRAWNAARPATRASAAGLAVACALMLCALTVARIPVWRDPFTLWPDTLRHVPRSAVALNNLGEAYGSIDRLDEAEDHFRAALKADPKFRVASANLGWALVKKGYAEDGMRLLEQSGATRPETLGMLAVAYAEAGRWKAAYPLLVQGLKLRPRDTGLHVYLGNYYFAQGDDAAAMAEYYRALAIGPRDPTVWNQLGAQHFKHGRTKEALDAFERAVKLAPSDPKVRANLGAALIRIGKRDEAGENLREAIRLSPRNATARSNLAAIHLQEGRLDEAHEELERALGYEPRNTDAVYNMACVEARRGQRDEAIRWLDRLAALGYRNAEGLRKDPDLASLRDDPRFTALLARMGQ